MILLSVSWLSALLPGAALKFHFPLDFSHSFLLPGPTDEFQSFSRYEGPLVSRNANSATEIIFIKQKKKKKKKSEKTVALSH
jgi:hypothetical protein